MVLHLLQSYEACTPHTCLYVLFFFRLLRSLSISRRMDHRLDVDAFDSVQHFDSKRFDSVLYTPLPQNKHRVITPIQLKWMDCYEMICVNPKTTINENFYVILSLSVSHRIVSLGCWLVGWFFLSFRNSMKLIFLLWI